MPLPTEGIYEDLKGLGARLVKPIRDRARRTLQRRRVLKSFSRRFAGQPREITDLVDYYGWHEDDEDWRSGKGLLCSATFGENFRFWTQPDHFVPYEARVKRFILSGGETKRIFFLSGEIADPGRRWALLRAAMRHSRLGFPTKVNSVLDLRHVLNRFEVDCHMFAVLNGRICYFVRFPEEPPALMVRTLDRTLTETVDNEFLGLWKSAVNFETWYKNQVAPLPDEVLEQVELDVRAVEDIAALGRSVLTES